MQTPLLDPFGTKIPDVIEHTLEEGIALTSKFNRKGSLLATGCSDGKVVLWDFDTKSPATSLDKHTMAVLGLSWSRNGRKLLTWAADQTVVVFDVKKGKACFRKSLSCVAKACAIHPRNEHMLLVCPAALDPLLITIKPDPGNEGMCIQESEHVIPIMASAPEGVQTHLGPTACFSRRGERMYFGTSWGTVDVYDTATRTRIQSVQVGPGSSCNFNAMAISRAGDWLALCCSDKSVIVVNAHTLERVNKFTDQVTHTPWQHVTFSSNGNYVIGCPADTNQHTINVWDREKGVLTKIMEGPKEHIRNVQWHPIRPVLVAISNFGSIHVWTVSQSDNWSAFAPDFKEIEENVEYEEREDEFDFVEETEDDKTKEEDTDEPVDILTVDNDHYASSDEEPFAPGEELLYLPSDPIVDTISAQEKADIERQQKEEERIASMYERRLKEVTALRGKLQHHAGRRQQLLRKKKKSGKRVKKKGASDAQPKTKKTKATTPTAAPAAEASTATTQ